MKKDREQHYAVLTGDIIASTRLPAHDRERLLTVINQSSRELRKFLGGGVPMDVDVYRGDGWQLLVRDPVQSLRAALFFRASLRWHMGFHHFDTRLAIGIGTVDLLSRRRVSEGTGKAFKYSGIALDSMKKRRMCFSFPDAEEEQYFDTIVHLLDDIAVRWSDKQAHAITGALRGWTQNEIARTWADSTMNQQGVAKHLEAAGWHAVKRGLDYFEERLSAVLRTKSGSGSTQ